MNELPKWEDCEWNCDHNMETALERFIYEYEPSSRSEEILFRASLVEALQEAVNNTIDNNRSRFS